MKLDDIDNTAIHTHAAGKVDLAFFLCDKGEVKHGLIVAKE